MKKLVCGILSLALFSNAALAAGTYKNAISTGQFAKAYEHAGKKISLFTQLRNQVANFDESAQIWKPKSPAHAEAHIQVFQFGIKWDRRFWELQKLAGNPHNYSAKVIADAAEFQKKNAQFSAEIAAKLAAGKAKIHE